jgi:hypothetical protein
MIAKQLIATVLIGSYFIIGGVKAQEGTPKPSFFEEERRLRTPTESDTASDRKQRREGGFTDSFLTDALGGVGDPGQSSESSGSLNTTSITPSQAQNTNSISNVVPITPSPGGALGDGVFVTPPLR